MKEFFYRVWDILTIIFYTILLFVIFTFNIPWNTGKGLIELTKEYNDGELGEFDDYLASCILTFGNVLISPITKPYEFVVESIKLMKDDNDN